MKKIVGLLALSLGSLPLFATPGGDNNTDSLIKNNRQSTLVGIKAVALPARNLVKVADAAALESFIRQQIRESLLFRDGVRSSDEELHQLFESQLANATVKKADEELHALFQNEFSR